MTGRLIVVSNRVAPVEQAKGAAGGLATGMLAALHVLCMLGHGDRPLSALIDGYERYATSGELNSEVDDTARAMEKVAAALARHGAADWSDGLVVHGDAGRRGPWRVSLRPSNTEALLRLNVEAKDPEVMAAVRDDVLALVRENDPEPTADEGDQT